MRAVRFFLCVVSLAAIEGCAFGNRKVNLEYPPGLNAAQRLQVPVSPPDARSVVLLTFIDQRSEKDRVGEVRNGFGMHTADVKAMNNVADWVTSAAKWELEKAGFRVTVVKARPGSSAEPVISGEVLKVHCGAYFKYGGEVEVALRVEQAGRVLVQRTYTGKGSAGTNWGATSESYRQALGEALRNAHAELRFGASARNQPDDRAACDQALTEIKRARIREQRTPTPSASSRRFQSAAGAAQEIRSGVDAGLPHPHRPRRPASGRRCTPRTTADGVEAT
jgi:hypothetical protein